MNNDVKGKIGENFVNQLAFNTYLDYWCYPNPKYENGDKKEICDLLIIFNNICIIFSVKNYDFKGNHKRFFNNTIEKAVKQISGAYKTLFKNEKVIITHPYKKEVVFPKDDINKVFRVVINLGEGTQFYNLERTTNNSDFINILDKETFITILDELNTIPDLIDYLEKRELFFKGKDVRVLTSPDDEFNVIGLHDCSELFKSNSEKDFIMISGTEKDLLSYFLKNTRNFPDVLTNKQYSGGIILIDNEWKNYKLNKFR